MSLSDGPDRGAADTSQAHGGIAVRLFLRGYCRRLPHRHQHRIAPVQCRELLAQRRQLRCVVVADVGRLRVVRHVVLVIALGRVEALAAAQLGDDRCAVAAGLAELGDVGAAGGVLARVGAEDRRPVLAAVVRPLAVELGRVVHHREEHLHQLPVADLARIVVDLHRFGVTGLAAADPLIVCVGGAATDKQPPANTTLA
ncbi:hypothetical protein G6F31_015784 [Rhizopus arrhizus]|nr:hypothetical protein G6F31_015784 [Rhizopus arrhizus]